MKRRLQSAISAIEGVLSDIHNDNYEMMEVKIGAIRNQLRILEDDLHEETFCLLKIELDK